MENKEIVLELELEFLRSMRILGVELSQSAVCSIYDTRIDIGIAATGAYKDGGFKMEFASELTLYAKRNNRFGIGRDYNEINFGSSGTFTPKDKSSYWRSIHAASILKNWDYVSKLVNSTCKRYSNL